MLAEILMRHVRHPELRWLTRTLLFHDPITNYRFRSRVPGVHGPDSPQDITEAVQRMETIEALRALLREATTCSTIEAFQESLSAAND